MLIHHLEKVYPNRPNLMGHFQETVSNTWFQGVISVWLELLSTAHAVTHSSLGGLPVVLRFSKESPVPGTVYACNAVYSVWKEQLYLLTQSPITQPTNNPNPNIQITIYIQIVKRNRKTKKGNIRPMLIKAQITIVINQLINQTNSINHNDTNKSQTQAS